VFFSLSFFFNAITHYTSYLHRYVLCKWETRCWHVPQFIRLRKKKGYCKEALCISFITTNYWAVSKSLWASSWSKMLLRELWWERAGTISSPVLASLLWLRVKSRIEFKFFPNIRNPLWPSSIEFNVFSTALFRSHTAGLLVVPRVWMGGRAFSYQAPLLWTSCQGWPWNIAYLCYRSRLLGNLSQCTEHLSSLCCLSKYIWHYCCH